MGEDPGSVGVNRSDGVVSEPSELSRIPRSPRNRYFGFAVVFVMLHAMVGPPIVIHVFGGLPGWGRVENGLYYVGNHANYTLVSERTYRNLEIYQWAFLGSLLILPVFVFSQLLEYRRRREADQAAAGPM